MPLYRTLKRKEPASKDLRMAEPRLERTSVTGKSIVIRAYDAFDAIDYAAKTSYGIPRTSVMNHFWGSYTPAPRLEDSVR